MHQLQGVGRVRSFDLGFERKQLFVWYVCLTLECSLRSVISLVNLLAVVDKEGSSSIGFVADDKVLLNDLGWELIRISQVARILTIFLTEPLVCKVLEQ